MEDIAQHLGAVKRSANRSDKVIVDDFIWGARGIGRVIDRTEKQTAHLLETGALKSVRKKGGRWVAHRPTLTRELTGE